MFNLTRLARTVVLIAATGLAMSVSAEVKVGDQAPNFSLAGSDGSTHSLADLRGKYVVVAFFPKAFTKG